jgi:hypothetical protein
MMEKVVVFISDIGFISRVLKLHTFRVKVKFLVSRFAFRVRMFYERLNSNIQEKFYRNNNGDPGEQVKQRTFDIKINKRQQPVYVAGAALLMFNHLVRPW